MTVSGQPDGDATDDGDQQIQRDDDLRYDWIGRPVNSVRVSAG
jgi:hypothetical protein